MKTEDVEFLKDLYQQVADRPLDPASDRRYVQLYGDDGIGEDPVEVLKRGIQWSPGQSVRLLSGFRGTGKSTELRRLQDRLRTAGYPVALIDMGEYLNMTTVVDVSDFLVVLAGATGEVLAAPDLLGHNQAHEGYWTRFSAFLKRTKITFPDVSPPGLKVNLRSDPTFRQQLQQHLSGHLGALSKDVCAFFEDCVKELKRIHGRDAELVLLVDSIDHIRGTYANALDVQASVEALFSGHPNKLKIPYVHCVYTVPPYLKVRYPNLGALYGAGAVPIFPAIKVRWAGSADEHDGGIQALRRVLLGRGDVMRLLGTEERVRRVILTSGGHMRDLLRLIGEITLRAHALPVDDRIVDAAIDQLRTELLPVSDSNARWLARVARTHEASLEDDQHLPNLARFFDTGMVLCYRDGPEWYDVHPLIKDLVLKQAQGLEERERAAREDAAGPASAP